MVVETPAQPLDAARTPGATSWISLLERNGTLRGTAKLTLGANDSSVGARADIPLAAYEGRPDPCEELAGRIEAASGGVAGALDVGVAAVPAPPRAPNADGAGRGARTCEARIAEACRAAGWTAEASPSGDVRVPLESGVATHRDATLRLGDDGVRIRAQLLPVDAPGLDDPGRAAAALLLLRASGALRMVRGVAAAGSASTPFLGLEVQLGPDPSRAELGHALSALSVAVDETAQEVDALIRDPALATLYLDRARGAGTACPGETSADPPRPPSKKRRKA